MFYFVLLMITLTNLGLGYAVATHFGYGPKSAAQLDVALAQTQGEQPSFAILGGSVDETPLSELPPATPIQVAQPTETEDPTPPAPNDSLESATDEVPSEVNDFTALGGVITADDIDNDSDDHSRID